jgi:hypothetical protein
MASTRGRAGAIGGGREEGEAEDGGFGAPGNRG